LPHRCGWWLVGAWWAPGGCDGRCDSPVWLVGSRPTPSPLAGARSARSASPFRFSRFADAFGAVGVIIAAKTANDPQLWPILFVATMARRCIDRMGAHRVRAAENAAECRPPIKEPRTRAKTTLRAFCQENRQR